MYWSQFKRVFFIYLDTYTLICINQKDMSRITDKFMDKPNRVIRQTTKHFIENLSLGKNPPPPRPKKEEKHESS